MKTCNKNCSYFKPIANTDECEQAICSYPNSFTPIEVESDCFIQPKPYTCADCDRLGNDFACYTCEAEDSAYRDGILCGGFIDKYEIAVEAALMDWALRGYNIEEKMRHIVEEFQKEFKPLEEVKDDV